VARDELHDHGWCLRRRCLGAESATLNVLSAGMTLTATLTGTGVPGFTLTPASLSFGNQDVGFGLRAADVDADQQRQRAAWLCRRL